MSRVRLFGSLISFDGIVFASYNLLTWANSSCVNQQLSCFLALLEFTHSFLVSSTRLPLDEKFDLLISFVIQVILFQAPCVLNEKFFTSMFHLQQVLKRPYGPPMEMVSGLRAGQSELSAALSTFQCNETKKLHYGGSKTL